MTKGASSPVPSHTPSPAQIKARLDELGEEWSLNLEDFGTRKGFTFAGESMEWTALIFDQCDKGFDCDCVEWDWSDSFHATSTCRGSRTEVTRWLMAQQVGPQQGWEVCFTDSEGYPLL